MVMVGEINHQLVRADSLQLARSNPAMVPIQPPSPGQRHPPFDRQRGECPPEHPETGMPLADVVEQGRPYCARAEPAGTGRLGGLVAVTLVSVRL